MSLHLRRCCLFALLSALVVAGGGGCERSAPSDDSGAAGAVIDGRGMNVLLVSVDTTRADCLGCYGHPLVKTPNIDRLAAEGARFAQCISSIPITLPSHSTILTGSYQFVHGARDNGMFVLGKENKTLAEVFKEAGYATHAAVAAIVMNQRYGIDQGFDTYDDLQRFEGRLRNAMRAAQPTIPSADLDQPEDEDTAPGMPKQPPRWGGFDRTADEVTRYGIELLERNKDHPFFIFLHYFDPHQPTKAPARFADQYADDYLAEIAFFDEQFGLLMDAFRGLGLAEKTLVILTSDHGEGRGDHGEQTHSYFVYDSTLHVPLIMSLPGRIPAGGVIESQVRLVDVAATIVDFAGLQRTPQMQGASLLPLLLDPAKDLGLPAYADTLSTQISFGYSPLRTLRAKGWKYILSPAPELYHVAEDPLELFNLARTEPQRAAAMREQLRRLIAKSPDPPSGRAVEQAPTKEDMKMLQALGYVGVTSDPGASKRITTTGSELDYFEPDGINPADHKEAIELMNVSLGSLLAGKFEDAETQYRRLLELEPNNAKAIKELADAVAAQDRGEEAEQLYREALALDPDNPLVRQGLGRVLLTRHDLPGAEEQYRLAVDLDPTDYGAHVLLGNVLVRLNRLEEALKEYEAAATLAPEVPTVIVQWAMGLKVAGRLSEAEAKLARGCQLDPDFPTPHLLLAQLLNEQARRAEATQELLAFLETHPDDIQALEIVASNYAKAGDLQNADQYYSRVAELDAEGPRGAFNLGISLALGGKLDEAIAQYRKAVELNPEYLRAHLKLAEVLVRAGRPDEAIQACERMLETMPKYPQAYIFAADLMSRLEKPARAINFLHTGHSLLEENSAIANDLAWRLATSPATELRDSQEAVRLARHAKDLTDGKDVNVLDTLAAAYAEAGRFEEAAATANQAIEMANQDGQTALAKRIADRLKLYEKRQPYRDTPIPPPASTDSEG